MTQYAHDQQQEQHEERPRIGGRDNDAKKAAAFLREVRPSMMHDAEALQTLDRLKRLVEHGTFNQLADQLNRLSRKHKKKPLPTIEIVQQLEALAERYTDQEEKTAVAASAATAQPDIILSETFVK